MAGLVISRAVFGKDPRAGCGCGAPGVRGPAGVGASLALSFIAEPDRAKINRDWEIKKQREAQERAMNPQAASRKKASVFSCFNPAIPEDIDHVTSADTTSFQSSTSQNTTPYDQQYAKYDPKYAEYDQQYAQYDQQYVQYYQQPGGAQVSTQSSHPSGGT